MWTKRYFRFHEIWRPVLIGQPLTLFLTQMKLSVLFLTSLKDFHLNKHQRCIFTAVPIITSLYNWTHSSNNDESLIDFNGLWARFYFIGKPWVAVIVVQWCNQNRRTVMSLWNSRISNLNSFILNTTSRRPILMTSLPLNNA